MVLDFANIDFTDRPVLVLKNAGGTPIGVLGHAYNVRVDINYNQVSTLEFDYPQYADGEETPCYNEIVGLRTVELVGVGQFTLVRPVENGDGINCIKTVEGRSLEYELTYKKITVPKGTYQFANPSNEGDTLVGMIKELLPTWTFSSVPLTIANRYRTFEVENENVYTFMMDTIQSTFGCLFIFDTYTRSIVVRDVNAAVSEQPVFISTQNLASSIEIEESTEDIVTRLDVNGADGVDIRDVNPGGTNRIIDLSYYMNTSNFPQALIDKYYRWKELYDSSSTNYYNLTVQYALKVSEYASKAAELTDLQNELTMYENTLGVAFQASASQLSGSDNGVTEAKKNIAAVQVKISEVQARVQSLETDAESLLGQMRAINNACNFDKYFTFEERELMDAYIKDGEISDSTFAAESTKLYAEESSSFDIKSQNATISNAEIVTTPISSSTVYDVKGGSLTCGSSISGNIITAVIDKRSDQTFVMTAYLGSGRLNGTAFAGGCVTIAGSGSVSASGNNISMNMSEVHLYFTRDITEYQKRSVAWDLYAYGSEMLEKMSKPTYTFDVTAANFLTSDEFVQFKNAIKLGEKIYLEAHPGDVLLPICIGVSIDYSAPDSITTKFSDSYSGGDSSFKLVDLLEESVSMGKNVSINRFAYENFMDSGASTEIHHFMTSALDVAKNSILSTSGQAVSWDAAGVRLRKWRDASETGFENEQIWLSNNSIMMTGDSWETASMAIGKFRDDSVGDCWGIVAPMVVGTMIAGNSLVIQSEKTYGDNKIAEFRVDKDGCRLYNATMLIQNDSTAISLDPENGIAIGSTGMYTMNEDGSLNFHQDKAKFYADQDGDLHLSGHLTAQSLTIAGEGGTEQSIQNYVAGVVEPIYEMIGNEGDNVNVVYADTQPTEPVEKDIWYDTANDKVWKYDGAKWSDISDTTFGRTLIMVRGLEGFNPVDGAIKTFFQADEPEDANEGDLWIESDAGDRMLRYTDGEWIVCQESISAVDNRVTEVHNGTTGLSFKGGSTGNIESVEINKKNGLKIVGANSSYFTVTNSKLGFYNSADRALLYYDSAFNQLVLNGYIYATGGTIGGWTIGNNSLYNGTSSLTSATNGVYLGTSGINVGGVIVMDTTGNSPLTIRSSRSTDSNDYIFKIEETYSGSGSYRLLLRNISFDSSFVLPKANGGTGDASGYGISQTAGIYRATSLSALNNMSGASNGDIGVVHSTVSSGATLSGQFNPSASGYLAISTSTSGHSTNYFGLGMNYWNISGLSKDNVSTSWARAGLGSTTAAKCGLFVPITISTTSSISLTSLTITFKANAWISGASGDPPMSGQSPGINVSLYSGSPSSYTKLATTTYNDYVSKVNDTKTAQVTFTGISISSGTYWVVFHSTTWYSTLWVNVDSKTFQVVGTGATQDPTGIYIRSSNSWVAAGGASSGGTVIGGSIVSASAEYNAGTLLATITVNGSPTYIFAPSTSTGSGGTSTYILPYAKTDQLGGVKVGSNISVDSFGVISIPNTSVFSKMVIYRTKSQGLPTTGTLTDGQICLVQV